MTTSRALSGWNAQTPCWDTDVSRLDGCGPQTRTNLQDVRKCAWKRGYAPPAEGINQVSTGTDPPPLFPTPPSPPCCLPQFWAGKTLQEHLPCQSAQLTCGSLKGLGAITGQHQLCSGFALWCLPDQPHQSLAAHAFLCMSLVSPR